MRASCVAVSRRRVSAGQSGLWSWLARPAADLLHLYACSGPRVMDRSWSSCPRSKGSSGWMGSPHRQHTRWPMRCRGIRLRRRRSCPASYPRCCRVPRACSWARAWSVHRDCPGGQGVPHDGSEQGCQARVTIGHPLRTVRRPSARLGLAGRGRCPGASCIRGDKPTRSQAHACRHSLVGSRGPETGRAECGARSGRCLRRTRGTSTHLARRSPAGQRSKRKRFASAPGTGGLLPGACCADWRERNPSSMCEIWLR